MSSNLRAAPIEAFVTDSAGNIIRNAAITIRDNAPGGSNIIDSVTSDDSGYFITSPLKNGVYDIYESGVKTSRTIHTPSLHNNQVWLATADNIPDNLPSFLQMDETVENDINKFRYYIQIENDNVDIQRYGHIFPIYDKDLTSIHDGWGSFVDFHNLKSDSRVTTTRFDVEFFNPITSSDTLYRRIRWVGIPAISFSIGSKLVLPLDYYSMKLNRLNKDSEFSGENVLFQANDSLDLITVYSPTLDAEFIKLLDTITVGDVVKFSFNTIVSPTTPPPAEVFQFYGIFVKESSEYLDNQDNRGLVFKVLRNSNYISTEIGHLKDNQDNLFVTEGRRYDGFFNGITNIGVSINEKFTAVENIYAQGVDGELYNYDTISS